MQSDTDMADSESERDTESGFEETSTFGEEEVSSRDERSERTPLEQGLESEDE